MGWKRYEFGRDPCPCGKGHFVVEINETDNGYSRDEYRCWIECDDCKAAYNIGGVKDQPDWVYRLWKRDGDNIIERFYPPEMPNKA